MNKAEKLLLQIKQHNENYRSGNPTITDIEYDGLVDELRRMDPDNAWFKRIEPAPVTASRKVHLPIPMKSLNKVKDMTSLLSWAKSIGLRDEDVIVITPKFDGLSLLHDERNNKAYSRGGSENEGQDCSAHYNAAHIVSSDNSKVQFTYGEFVFNRKTWNEHFLGQISSETGDKYKSPRNTAAGLLNRDQPSEKLRYVDFFRYGVDEASLANFNTYIDLYTHLCSTYKQRRLYEVIRVKDLTEQDLLDFYKEFSKEYFIDGLVLYANDFKIWKRAGRQETTGNPNYAIAYKNPVFTETFETEVLGINWKVSKAGALKPVVKIDMVDTGDCEMENPTGYNAKYIMENNIGKGAIVKVTRSGGVIPKILEVIKPATQKTMQDMWDELTECPDCGEPTKWNDTMVELCCVNHNCPGIQLAKIVFFYTTVGAENMGEETIAKMFNAGYNSLRRILDITFEDLIDIEGFGEGIANIILNNNKRIKEGIEVTKLMHASDCFPGIGEIKAKKILSQLTDFQVYQFTSGLMYFSEQEIQKSKQRKTIMSFLNGIKPFYEFVARNGLAILPMETQKATSNRYAGFRVCFTGVRDLNLEKQITDGNGVVVSGVTKTTTHLIVKEHGSNSSKAVKAKKFGIPTFTLEEFKERC